VTSGQSCAQDRELQCWLQGHQARQTRRAAFHFRRWGGQNRRHASVKSRESVVSKLLVSSGSVSKLIKDLPFTRAKGETSHGKLGLVAFPGCHDEIYELKYAAVDLNATQGVECCDSAFVHAAGSL